MHLPVRICVINPRYTFWISLLLSMNFAACFQVAIPAAREIIPKCKHHPSESPIIDKSKQYSGNHTVPRCPGGHAKTLGQVYMLRAGPTNDEQLRTLIRHFCVWAGCSHRLHAAARSNTYIYTHYVVPFVSIYLLFF